MRRKDREVTDKSRITEVIKSCSVCRIAMWDKAAGIPYIVPLNFGYEWKEDRLVMYFHCASEGRKLTLLHENPQVSFEMDCGHELLEGSTACSYGYNFQSVMGEGTVRAVIEVEEKRHGLDLLMRHMTEDEGGQFTYADKILSNITVLCLESQSISCKIHE